MALLLFWAWWQPGIRFWQRGSIACCRAPELVSLDPTAPWKLGIVLFMLTLPFLSGPQERCGARRTRVVDLLLLFLRLSLVNVRTVAG